MFDLHHYLKDDLLVKVDRASMWNGLEVRVPLLDHELVELSLNISHKFKISKSSTKFILKEILYDDLPKSLFDRPKWGFSIPLADWLQSDLRFLVDDYLSEQVVDEVGLVKFEVVHKLKKEFFEGKKYLYNRIWALVQIHKFLLNGPK